VVWEEGVVFDFGFDGCEVEFFNVVVGVDHVLWIFD